MKYYKRPRAFYQSELLLGVALLGIFVAYNFDRYNDVQKEKVQQVEYQNKKSPLDVTFEEMSKAYLSNHSEADKMYKGKSLIFRGTVKTVSEGIMGEYNVSMDAGFLSKDQPDNTHVSITVDEHTSKSLHSGDVRTFQAIGGGANITDGWVSALMFINGTTK